MLTVCKIIGLLVICYIFINQGVFCYNKIKIEC